MGGNKGLHMVAFILLVVGGLNWLAVGLFQKDLGMYIGGEEGLVARILYILVGLSAIYEIISHKATCKFCEGMGKKPTTM